MKLTTWEIVALVAQIGSGICGVLGFVAAKKTDEMLDARIHRLILEDKAGNYGRRNW